MRNKLSSGGLTVNAVAGTHVVLLGFDLAESKRKGCLGFAIQRRDHNEDECYWLSGTKTFEETCPSPGLGVQVSSRKHPFQTFQWADYSAKPGYDYTYRVISIYGTPSSLKDGDEVSVRVSAEHESGEKHSVFFNRGAIASQEYARRFQNKSPEEAGEAAFCWLSRGLLEAMTGFIDRAKDSTYGLYGAVYEFQWSQALEAIRAASKTGATVSIIYDAISGKTGPLKANTEAITAAGINQLCIPHTLGKIMHNKFFVLTRNNVPIAVWTGSTNLTKNGIFGHSNCGHIIEDGDIAKAYFDYWEELKKDADSKTERAWIANNNAAPPDPWDKNNQAIFSPRSGLDVLHWYADIATGRKPLFMTFAFGMHPDFQKVYEQKDGILRVALMEKEGNGRGLEQGKKDIRRIRALPNVIIAVGNTIVTNCFDRWLEEKRQLTSEANVKWVHTKYMLIDPLSESPVVVTGSANFSEASTNANNENMLVIKNDTRVADIYLGEFMRLYSHYAFREALAISRARGDIREWQPNYLKPNDSWQTDYYTKGDSRFLRRRYFAGIRD